MPKCSEEGLSSGHCCAKPAYAAVSRAIAFSDMLLCQPSDKAQLQAVNTSRATMRSTRPSTGQSIVVLLGKRRQFESSRSGRKMFPPRPPVKLPTISQSQHHQLPFIPQLRDPSRRNIQKIRALDAAVGFWSIVFASVVSPAPSDGCDIACTSPAA